MDPELAARFDATDRRIDSLAGEMFNRFEVVDRRFDRQLAGIAQQFEAMQQRTDERFDRLIEALSVRFDAIDRRFDAIDRRFEAIDRRFDHVIALVAGQFEAMRRTDQRCPLEGSRADRVCTACRN